MPDACLVWLFRDDGVFRLTTFPPEGASDAEALSDDLRWEDLADLELRLALLGWELEERPWQGSRRNFPAVKALRARRLP